jgi:hypothetical protein
LAIFHNSIYKATSAPLFRKKLIMLQIYNVIPSDYFLMANLNKDLLKWELFFTPNK